VPGACLPRHCEAMEGLRQGKEMVAMVPRGRIRHKARSPWALCPAPCLGGEGEGSGEEGAVWRLPSVFCLLLPHLSTLCSTEMLELCSY
jgi:hypothetical protein